MQVYLKVEIDTSAVTRHRHRTVLILYCTVLHKQRIERLMGEDVLTHIFSIDVNINKNEQLMHILYLN